MSTATEIAKYTNYERWLTNAKEDKSLLLPVPYYKVTDDKGKDVTNIWASQAYKYVQNGFLVNMPSTTIYRLEKSVLDTILGLVQSQLTSLRKLQEAAANQAAIAYQEAIGMGPINKSGELIYNVGNVKQAYIRTGKPTKKAGSDEASNFDTFGSGYGNSPKLVKQAIELWTDSSNHKGMIATWTPPSSIGIDSATTSGMGTYGTKDPNKYAFQFLYNPQPITMAYKGAPPIDISQYTSGSEDYALWAGGSAGGTISFDILLMRMYDMPYYKPDAKGKGILTKPGIYVNRQPLGATTAGSLFDEQDAIYNRGTMYDLEFLLRTVLGVTIDSSLRNVKTADIGWVGAMPVEIHLGPGLRYWGTVAGLTVNHVLFNERMVPMFSTVRVEISRLPDYNWAKGDVVAPTSLVKRNGGTLSVSKQEALRRGASLG